MTVAGGGEQIVPEEGVAGGSGVGDILGGTKIRLVPEVTALNDVGGQAAPPSDCGNES